MKIKNKNNSNYKLKSHSHRIINFINETKGNGIELQNVIDVDFNNKEKVS